MTASTTSLERQPGMSSEAARQQRRMAKVVFVDEHRFPEVSLICFQEKKKNVLWAHTYSLVDFCKISQKRPIFWWLWGLLPSLTHPLLKTIGLVFFRQGAALVHKGFERQRSREPNTATWLGPLKLHIYTNSKWQMGMGHGKRCPLTSFWWACELRRFSSVLALYQQTSYYNVDQEKHPGSTWIYRLLPNPESNNVYPPFCRAVSHKTCSAPHATKMQQSEKTGEAAKLLSLEKQFEASHFTFCSTQASTPCFFLQHCLNPFSIRFIDFACRVSSL